MVLLVPKSGLSLNLDRRLVHGKRNAWLDMNVLYRLIVMFVLGLFREKVSFYGAVGGVCFILFFDFGMESEMRMMFAVSLMKAATQTR